MIDLVDKTGRRELAEVYLATVRNDPSLLVEFVDACDPAAGGRERKWVVIVSTQLGCPVKCLMCDAGARYRGNLSAEEILAQVEHVVAANVVNPADCAKFKVQFARMGEPALNGEVLKALWRLKDRFPGVIPCVATIAPAGRRRWFSTLLGVRDYFSDFQLQFSINSTDQAWRDQLMPYPKEGWEWLAQYGRRFYRPAQRKVALNFAVCAPWPVDADSLAARFDPRWFAVKLTPLNPTAQGAGNALPPLPRSPEDDRSLAARADELRARGFDVIVSLGDPAENDIGSNCGQAVARHLRAAAPQMGNPAR